MENSFYSVHHSSLFQFHPLSNLMGKKADLQEAGFLQANLRSKEPQSSQNVHPWRKRTSESLSCAIQPKGWL